VGDRQRPVRISRQRRAKGAALRDQCGGRRSLGGGGGGRARTCSDRGALEGPLVRPQAPGDAWTLERTAGGGRKPRLRAGLGGRWRVRGGGGRWGGGRDRGRWRRAVDYRLRKLARASPALAGLGRRCDFKVGRGAGLPLFTTARWAAGRVAGLGPRFVTVVIGGRGAGLIAALSSGCGHRIAHTCLNSVGASVVEVGKQQTAHRAPQIALDRRPRRRLFGDSLSVEASTTGVPGRNVRCDGDSPRGGGARRSSPRARSRPPGRRATPPRSRPGCECARAGSLTGDVRAHLVVRS